MVKTSEGDFFSIHDGNSADQKVLNPIGSVGGIQLQRIPELLPVCRHLTPNTPAGNFEVFAHTFAEHYISLDLKRVNWDSLVQSTQLTINPATSPTRLFELLKGLIEPLGKGHTAIEAPASIANFKGFVPAAISSQKAKPKPTSSNMICRFFGVLLIVYGHLSGEIGYLRILAMGGYSKHGDLESDPHILESTPDTIFSDTNLQSLVLDLRINFGGSGVVGLAIASRFANTEYLAFIKQAQQSVRPYSLHRT
jgi:hypothetical protein